MNDNDYDKLLTEIFNEKIVPSEKLIIQTKEKLVEENAYEKWIGLAVFVNALLFLGLVFYIIFMPQPLTIRILLYSAVTTGTNVVIMLIYIFRERIEEVFY